ncbi:MAG: isoprenyl transferase [Gammaproteobacteria bacterium]|nr:isoprenyl transferase [Gammaproteobacteria bacterium]
MSELPDHIAIIMDGNGRWARQRKLPRHLGHKSGVDSTRDIIQICSDRHIKALTLFAFSSENWKRPKKEVGLLMNLFFTALQREIKRLNDNNVRMTFIGDVSAFPDKLQKQISRSAEKTSTNTGLELRIAVNYGGRWDIVNAVRGIAEKIESNELNSSDISEELVAENLSLSDLPEPDLFIRTGGEKRISNFLLWQLAYTELYFCDVLWPDFNEKIFDEALESYALRQRRFGKTGEQVKGKPQDA